MTRRHVKLVVFWTVVGVWAVATLGWISLLIGERILMSSASCEYQAGDSLYGEASWSWAPPGVTCRTQLNLDGKSVKVVEDPPIARLAVAGALALWGASIIGLGVVALARGQGVDGEANASIPPANAA